jgi:hypothetical protein
MDTRCRDHDREDSGKCGTDTHQRSGSERPCCRCAAEQRDDLAPM